MNPFLFKGLMIGICSCSGAIDSTTKKHLCKLPCFVSQTLLCCSEINRALKNGVTWSSVVQHVAKYGGTTEKNARVNNYCVLYLIPCCAAL
jgi:hypothetical protein